MQPYFRKCAIAMVPTKQMKQLSLAQTGFLLKVRKQNRKAAFLSEMERVVPWSQLEVLIEPFYPKTENGHPQMPLSTMLRIYYMQQWFGYSDPAMEDALHDMPLLRQFAGLEAFEDVMPDENTIFRFRHLLENHVIWPWRSLPRSARFSRRKACR
jgi:transposase, IS5 family